MAFRPVLGSLGFGAAISGIVACASVLGTGLLSAPGAVPGLRGDGGDLVVPEAVAAGPVLGDDAPATTPDRRSADADGAVRTPVARVPADARPARRADGRVVAPSRRPPLGPNPRRRSDGARGTGTAPLPATAPAPSLGQPPAAGTTTPSAPAITPPPRPSTLAPATPAPAPVAPAVAARRVRLTLTDLAMTPASKRTAGTLRLRYAVAEEATRRSLPETVDVALQVPRVRSAEALRVSVDLAHGEADAATSTSGHLRVRMSLVDETDLDAPSVAETAAAHDGSSNTLDVVTPLGSVQSGTPTVAETLPPAEATTEIPAAVEVPITDVETPEAETVSVALEPLSTSSKAQAPSVDVVVTVTPSVLEPAPGPTPAPAPDAG